MHTSVHRRPPQGEHTLRALGSAAPFLLLVATFGLSAAGAYDWDNAVWPVLWLIAAAAAIVVKFGVRRIDDPLVIVFTLGVLPMVGGLAAFPSTQYEVRATTVQLTWLAAQTFITIALLVGRGKQPTFRVARFGVDTRFLILLMLTCFAAQVTAFTVFAWTRGIPLLAFNAEQVRVDASSGAGPMVLVLTAAPLLTVALIAFIPAATWWQKAALLAIGVVSLALPALTGSRSALLKVLVVWVVCVYASRTVPRGTVKLASVMAAAIGVVWIIGTVRYTGSEQSFAMLLGQRLAADPYSANLIIHGNIQDPRVTGIGLFLTAFATYAPGFQPLVGDLLKELVGLDFAGGAIAVPLASEGWLAAGWAGVAAFSLVAVAVPAAISRLSDHNSAPVVIASTIFAVTWAGAYGTGIATVLATFAVPTFVLLLSLCLVAWGIWVAMGRLPITGGRR